MKLTDTRTRDDLIRDDFSVPDGSLEDGQYDPVRNVIEEALYGS